MPGAKTTVLPLSSPPCPRPCFLSRKSEIPALFIPTPDSCRSSISGKCDQGARSSLPSPSSMCRVEALFHMEQVASVWLWLVLSQLAYKEEVPYWERQAEKNKNFHPSVAPLSQSSSITPEFFHSPGPHLQSFGADVLHKGRHRYKNKRARVFSLKGLPIFETEHGEVQA